LLAAEFDQLCNVVILFRVLRLQLLNLLLQRHQQESFLLVFLSLLCDRCELAGDSLLWLGVLDEAVLLIEVLDGFVFPLEFLLEHFQFGP
jgi:hypothetical protein